MKRKLHLLFLLFIITVGAQAQITVDSADFGTLGDMVIHAEDTSVAPGTQITPGDTAAQSWDYSSLNRERSLIIEFKDPENHPDSTRFSYTDFVLPYLFGDGFFTKNDTQLLIHGVSGDGFDSGFPAVLEFDEPAVYIEFPSTISSTFSQTSTSQTTFEDTISGQADSIRVEYTLTTYSHCDAHGTLETPDSVFQNTLRQYAEVTFDVEVFAVINFPGVPDMPVFDTSMVTHTYNWYAKGARHPVLQALVDQQDGEILSASFSAGNKPIPDFTVNHVSCFGEADGSISVDTIIGSDSTYNFLWSNGSQDSAITGIDTGTYTVTVYGGSDSTVVEHHISQPDSIFVEGVVTDASGSGQNDGKILIPSGNVSGGESPYFFEWSNGKLTRHNEGITPGLYTLTITDDDGCSNEYNYEVRAVYATVNPVSCHGGSDGTVVIDSIAGSESNYTYLWSTGSQDSAINGLSAGTYTLTIYGSNDSSFMSYQVTEPDPITVDATVTNASSADDEDGAVTVDNVSAGNPPYSYAWSTGDTTASIDSVGSGVYTLTVTDSEGCTKEFSFEVSDPAFAGSNAKQDHLKVYPNPAVDFVRVEYTRGLDHLRIYDLTGKELFAVRANNAESVNIDISGLPEGMYLLKVQSGDETKTVKLKK